jgi:hypothetical protein
MASGTGAYFDMLDAVKRYYGTYDPDTGLWSGSDQWEEIAKYGIRPDNVDIVKQVEGVDIIYNADGSYRSWNYNNPFSTDTVSVAEEINSNTQSGIYGTANTFNAPVPVNTSVNSSTGNYNMASGSKSVSTGASVSTIARTVSTAIAAVTAGCRLGKFFAQETYNQNPDYWDEQLPTMNPETWSSIAGDNELGQKVMQFLFGIDPETNETTAYMDEDALAYMAYSMYRLGMFEKGEETVVESPLTITPANFPLFMANTMKYSSGSGWEYEWTISDGTGALFIPVNGLNDWATLVIASDNPNATIHWKSWYNGGLRQDTTSVVSTLLTYDNKTVYGYINTNWQYLYINPYESGMSGLNSPRVTDINILKNIAWSLIYGDIEKSSPVQGVSDQPDYTAPDTSTWTDPDATKQSLKQQYPEYWDGAIYNDVPQPDGTSKRYTYVPVPTTPTTSKKEKQPTNTTVTKNQTKVNPNTSPDDVTNTITRYITDSSSPTPEDVPTTPETPVDNPPDTGDGDTPAVVVPTGNASALWSVYNPSQAQLDSFGSWLWSSDFFSQLKKLFNDPMQAIIGVHKVFATPQVSGQSTIKCGYIDSEVPSNVVGSQYVTVNCGSVSLREYFGNVFDYAPYTEVKLFLPFIGVVPLDTSYVMRGSISVTYHVDVITGACLAEVSVRRDSAGGIIYTFGGSCIVQYPVSSGSYMSVISGVLGTVASGVMAGVSIGAGNPIGAVYGISGAAQSILNTHTNVQHSGGFTGCTGAMGGKKPYLIISRPQTELNGHEPHMSGLPSNDYITLSSRSGFIRCKHVHVTGIDNATASEKDEIERLLKQGVLI